MSIEPGQVLALGYGSATPQGFLGTVTAVGQSGGQTVLQTQPATLAQAGANGTLDLATFQEVGPDAHSRRQRAPGRAASLANAFNPDLSKEIKCEDGAQAALSGHVSVSVVPSLKAHFSLFGGLKSASFAMTGTASAGLTATADASAGCTLESTQLLRDPLHIATFEGAIGVIPVVVELEGQVFVSGELSGKAHLESSVDASASITGGIAYDHGRFSPVFSGPNAQFQFTPPTVTADADASVAVEPALQLLLYGVAGPQLGIKGGLDFAADTTANPWWTLTAPFSLEASLTAPDLDLDSGSLTLYSHTFHVADAGGPLGGPAPVGPTPGQAARHVSNYVSSADLGCSLTTTEDTDDEFYTSDGDSNDACGTFLALDGTLYGPQDVPAGGDLGDYTAWTPVSQQTTGDGSAGSPFVTTTVVAAADTGVELTETDTWTAGGSTVTSRMALSGPSGDTDSALLYRAADCYVGDADTGLGGYDAGSQTVSCLRDDGNGSTSTAEQLVPVTPGATSVEDFYSQVWSDLGAQEPLPDSCSCSDYQDDGLAVAWPVTLAGSSPVAEQSQFAFTTVPGTSADPEAVRARAARLPKDPNAAPVRRGSGA